MTRTYLDDILLWHRRRVSADARSFDDLLKHAQACEPARGFSNAIRTTPHLAVIAEIKRRSPSKGDLNTNLDPQVMAQSYQAGGASCLSVLTDSQHFGGSIEDLQAARQSCSIPVIRKDFTVDRRDVCDARIMGADCVLLIAAALTAEELQDFLEIARMIDIDALVEIHDERELEIAINSGASMIGVNQRDLITFSVDHERAVRMGALIPSDCVKVAESGVRGVQDARSLRQAGYDAVLVGEHLVTAPDPAAALTELCVE